MSDYPTHDEPYHHPGNGENVSGGADWGVARSLEAVADDLTGFEDHLAAQLRRHATRLRSHEHPS